MSDGKNRNDNMQDYLDLLEEYGKIEPVTQEEEETELLIDVKAVNVNKEAQNEVKTELIFNNTEIELPEASAEEAVFEENNDKVSVISGEEAAEEYEGIKGDDFFKDYEVLDEEEVFGAPSEKEEEPKKAYREVKLFGDDDVLSTDPEEKEKNPFKRFNAWYKRLPKGKKAAVAVVAFILALIIVLGTVLGIFITSKFNKMGTNLDSGYEDDVIYEDEDFDSISGQIGSSNFNQALKDWATTGNDSHMSSKNVINVLLIGADSRRGTNSGNTDVMMIVSVNKKTKQLKLVSFFRDSYLYIEGKKSSYCSKLNAAYSMGGAETLIQTIENNYKIDIDNYVMVNFKSFESIIDAMGGIKVDVKKYEADYNYKKFKISLPVGENVKLNGEQALCFVRIRGCDPDGDVSRTRRQRQVINAMLDRVMNSSISELNKYIDVLMPYVDTGYSQGQILSLGLKALAGGWAKYERTQLQMPPEDCRDSGSANGWVWVVDYQKAANILQTELYGSSNIVLEEGRTTIIDVYKGANYQSNSSSNKNDDNKQNVVILDPNIPDETENVDIPEDTTEENTDINDIPDETENVDIPDETEEVTEEIPTEGTTAPVTEVPTSSPTTTTAAPVSTNPASPVGGDE